LRKKNNSRTPAREARQRITMGRLFG